ncbi:MAG: hypothetical protein MJ195_01635 [Mycoplasmoidaceae bacterium]|nr:hypothetical protein [Mycoplasmoidaceae bacterium]
MKTYSTSLPIALDLASASNGGLFDQFSLIVYSDLPLTTNPGITISSPPAFKQMLKGTSESICGSSASVPHVKSTLKYDTSKFGSYSIPFNSIVGFLASIACGQLTIDTDTSLASLELFATSKLAVKVPLVGLAIILSVSLSSPCSISKEVILAGRKVMVSVESSSQVTLRVMVSPVASVNCSFDIDIICVSGSYDAVCSAPESPILNVVDLTLRPAKSPTVHNKSSPTSFCNSITLISDGLS